MNVDAPWGPFLLLRRSHLALSDDDGDDDNNGDGDDDYDEKN